MWQSLQLKMSQYTTDQVLPTLSVLFLQQYTELKKLFWLCFCAFAGVEMRSAFVI